MKVGKHTAFMIDFLSDFADGKMSKDDFEMDYSGYVIEHFPMMLRIIVYNVIADLFGIYEPDLIQPGQSVIDAYWNLQQFSLDTYCLYCIKTPGMPGRHPWS